MYLIKTNTPKFLCFIFCINYNEQESIYRVTSQFISANILTLKERYNMQLF